MLLMNEKKQFSKEEDEFLLAKVKEAKFNKLDNKQTFHFLAEQMGRTFSSIKNRYYLLQDKPNKNTNTTKNKKIETNLSENELIGQVKKIISERDEYKSKYENLLAQLRGVLIEPQNNKK